MLYIRTLRPRDSDTGPSRGDPCKSNVYDGMPRPHSKISQENQFYLPMSLPSYYEICFQTVDLVSLKNSSAHFRPLLYSTA